MSFPRYMKYKASGVEWLGDVPDGWGVVQFKQCVEIQNGSDHKHIEQSEGYPVFGSGGIFAYASDFLYDGESVLLGRKGTVDKPLHVTGRFWTVDTMYWTKIRPNTSGRYVYYLAVTIPFDYYSTNTALPSMTKGALSSHLVTLPPLAEQTAIADFLDRETAKIDDLVAEQRRLMELLKEKRQAVISHAVTKGLNPHAKMKPSGIEWLGDVPEHWKVTRLCWICSEINDINHEMPTAVESGVPFLSAKDLLDDGTLNFKTDIKMISEEDFAKLSRKICPRRGDIIYSRIGACLGKARLVETDLRFLISYSCCVVRVSDTVARRRFIRHLLDGEMILTEAQMRTQGIGVPDLGLHEIGRFPVPLPSVQEQEKIADFIETELSKFDTLTAEAQRAIDLLQERRTALISAAVTGQIDVRQETRN
jgi:type I restriction enzyme S subunit